MGGQSLLYVSHSTFHTLAFTALQGTQHGSHTRARTRCVQPRQRAASPVIAPDAQIRLWCAIGLQKR